MRSMQGTTAIALGAAALTLVVTAVLLVIGSGEAPWDGDDLEIPGPRASVGTAKGADLDVQASTLMHPGIQTGPASRSSLDILYVGVAFLSLSTLIAVAMSFYLYYWRRILLANPHMLLPEELGVHLRRHTNSISRAGEAISGFEQLLVRHSEMQSSALFQVQEEAKSVLQALLTFQSALDAKDEEIERLRKGYDAEIYRKFLRRFLRVDQAIREFACSDSTNSEMLRDLRDLMEDAFAECDVEAFTPSTGIPYKTAEGVADHPKQVSTDIADDVGKIAEILDAGYRIRSGEKYEYLLPAKVSVFVPESRDSEG